MTTIVELYDKEPIFNILASASFSPENVVFIGGKIMDQKSKNRLLHCLQERNSSAQVYFYTVDANRISSVKEVLEKVWERFPGCVLDITGGRDTMLYAAGAFCSGRNIPVMVYEKQKECFLNLQNCPEAEVAFVSPRFHAKEFLIMAGGSFPRSGHVGASNITSEMEEQIKVIWKLYLKKYRSWAKHVQYLQYISGGNNSGNLDVFGDLEICMPDGKTRYCDQEIFHALAKCGAITDLSFRNNRISFHYSSLLMRNCLCDVGIWLELYLYVTAKNCGYFDDVQMSVVIDWDGESGEKNGTSNELDVFLTKNTTPIFISCKTGTPNTQALNELDVLRERYGGAWAKAILATMSDLSHENPAIYRRAADMGIFVLQQEDLAGDNLPEKLLSIVKSR